MTCRLSETDGSDELEIGIALPSGHHANQSLDHHTAPKTRMNRKMAPREWIMVKAKFAIILGERFTLTMAD